MASSHIQSNTNTQADDLVQGNMNYDCSQSNETDFPKACSLLVEITVEKQIHRHQYITIMQTKCHCLLSRH